MNKRTDQKEKTRENILKVALELYARNGIAVTTTAEIAIKSQVSHGTIFAHFPTKECLIEEVISKFGTTVIMRLHELIDLQCGMKEVLMTHLQVINEFEELYIRLITEVPLLDSNVNYTLIGMQSTLSFHIAQVAEREMIEGMIKNMPLHLLFNTWIGLVHYYLINKELFAPDEKVITRYGSELIDHFMNLISVEGGEVR
ncbi:MAG: TetR/AcrR family transcriptional regulator [Mobilitalea sp.]